MNSKIHTEYMKSKDLFAYTKAIINVVQLFLGWNVNIGYLIEKWLATDDLHIGKLPKIRGKSIHVPEVAGEPRNVY